jgi:hypothetical protein
MQPKEPTTELEQKYGIQIVPKEEMRIQPQKNEGIKRC